MATIRASCGDCGDVELTSADLMVRVCRDDNSGTYSFTCPHCAKVVVKAAEARIVELLVTSGVQLTTWSLPKELDERPDGAPIDHDDLLDFHTLLQGDGWMDDIHRLTRG